MTSTFYNRISISVFTVISELANYPSRRTIYESGNCHSQRIIEVGDLLIPSNIWKTKKKLSTMDYSFYCLIQDYFKFWIFYIPQRSQISISHRSACMYFENKKKHNSIINYIIEIKLLVWAKSLYLVGVNQSLYIWFA